jgi:hypothetical protein
MSVSEEADRRLLLLKMEKGLLVIEEIVEVSRIREACMDDRAFMTLSEKGPPGEPVQIARGQGCLGKEQGFTESLAQNEVVGIFHQILVMVPHEGQCTTFPDKTQAFCRRSSITHDIAETEEFIDLLSLDVCKDCLQGIDVAMDIGDEGNARHPEKLHPQARQEVSIIGF